MPKTNDFLKSGQTIKSVIDLSLFTAADGKLPKRIKVLPCGEWNTMMYGPMAIDDGICTQMVANFKADVRKAVPIDVDHDGGKAVGWINDLEAVSGDGVYAKVEWNKVGKDLLSEKIYRLFSPEWSFDYVDPEKSTHHGAVLIAGSLTNRPLFKELPVLVASDGTDKQVALLLNSEDNKIMNIEDILKKAVADRSAEEVEFLKTAELSDEQKAQLEAETKEVKTEVQETEEQKAEREKAEAEAKAKTEAEKTPEQIEAEKAEAEKVEAEKAKVETEARAQAEAEAAKTASEDKDVTIKASELKIMKEKLEALEASEKKMAVEKEISKFVANENGGKFAPANKDLVRDFVLTCSDSQKSAFFKILETLPEMKIAGQTSASSSASLTATEELNQLIASEVKASEGKLSIPEATKKVIASHTDLAKRYSEELLSNNK